MTPTLSRAAKNNHRSYSCNFTPLVRPDRKLQGSLSKNGPCYAPLVHLVGSVPLQSTEDVLSTLTEQLAGRIPQIPDGETGDRGGFTRWQIPTLPPQILELQFQPDQGPKFEATFDPTFELTADAIRETGYDRAAFASYAVFRQMRDDGKIPPNIRFQVSLPTPANVISSKVHAHFVKQAETLYEARLLAALGKIQDVIPLRDLAIQWDMAIEMAHMEHSYGPQRDDFTILQPYYSPVKEGIAERAARLAAGVLPEVPMGYHFCYGDFGHKHFLEPLDAGLLVDVINAVYEKVSRSRSVQWVHLPVPKSRDDNGYYSPLARLSVSSDTNIILGLVHAYNEEGTRRRVAAASKALHGRRFGVSTECGLGRTLVEDLDSIFHICREVTKDA